MLGDDLIKSIGPAFGILALKPRKCLQNEIRRKLILFSGKSHFSFHRLLFTAFIQIAGIILSQYCRRLIPFFLEKIYPHGNIIVVLIIYQAASLKTVCICDTVICCQYPVAVSPSDVISPGVKTGICHIIQFTVNISTMIYESINHPGISFGSGKKIDTGANLFSAFIKVKQFHIFIFIVEIIIGQTIRNTAGPALCHYHLAILKDKCRTFRISILNNSSMIRTINICHKSKNTLKHIHGSRIVASGYVNLPAICFKFFNRRISKLIAVFNASQLIPVPCKRIFAYYTYKIILPVCVDYIVTAHPESFRRIHVT